MVDVQVTVVGLTADGWSSLHEDSRRLVRDAEFVIGSTRHLALLPHLPGQRRSLLPGRLRDELPRLIAEANSDRVVVLASGDPLLAGIGSTLVELLGPERVRIVPTVSSVALALAELRWSAESCTVVRVTGDDVYPVTRELAPNRRVLILSADESTPRRVADLLNSRGYGASSLHVLGDLGTGGFTRLDTTAADYSSPASRLNIVALQLVGPHRTIAAGLPDDDFEHDGQITKRDLRASALARLQPAPGEHLWDVGAGSGAIGIEWMRSDRTCTASAIEQHPDRAALVARNAEFHGVRHRRIVTGAAPDAFADLETPDAIFIGGGATAGSLIEQCLATLRAGGRLVVHAVTVESERLVADLFTQHGGELVRISVATAEPLGSFSGFKPARTVTQWALTIGVI